MAVFHHPEKKSTDKRGCGVCGSGREAQAAGLPELGLKSNAAFTGHSKERRAVPHSLVLVKLQHGTPKKLRRGTRVA